MSRLLTAARDEMLQRRYAPPASTWDDSKQIACIRPRDVGGALQVLIGHASRHRTHGGILYNRRVRLVRRFGLSAFRRAA